MYVLTMKKQILKNPPVVEAVCEVRFNNGFDLDQATVDGFYEKIKTIFPKRDKVKFEEIKVEFDKVPDKSPRSNHTISERDRFLSTDNYQFVQIDKGIFAVHFVNKYSSWSDFSSKIFAVYEAFCSFLPEKSIKRVGVRYVNAIEIKVPKIDYSEYLNIYPLSKNIISSDNSLFSLELLDRSHDDHQTVIRMQRQMNPEYFSRFILDIDTFSENIGILNNASFKQKADDLHESLEKVFFATLTEKIAKNFY